VCDELDNRAALCDAVNLILRREGKLVGLNVDGEAFYRGLLRSHPVVSMKDAAILGCGGVSTAVAACLAPILRTVKLVDIDLGRAEGLSERLRSLNESLHIEVCRRPGAIDFSGCDFMYNGTGLGKMSSDPASVLKTPLETSDVLPRVGIAVDANYTPETTPFLAALRQQGLTLENGRSHMLAFVSIHIEKLIGQEVAIDSIERA
jgi:shikimate dehydrogenase